MQLHVTTLCVSMYCYHKLKGSHPQHTHMYMCNDFILLHHRLGDHHRIKAQPSRVHFTVTSDSVHAQFRLE